MGADFKPVLDGYANLRPFMFWAQTTLPTVFDDSLSYYEVLTKLCKMVNVLLENTDTAEHNIEAIAETYGKLQDYVNHYFDNLNVSEEVNAKLDEMASDGTLSAMIEPIVEHYTSEIIDDVVHEQLSTVVSEQIGGEVANQIDGAIAPQITPKVNAYLDANLPALVDERVPIEVGEQIDDSVSALLPSVVDTQLPGVVSAELVNDLPPIVDEKLPPVVASQLPSQVSGLVPAAVYPIAVQQTSIIVPNWLATHITNPSNPPLDTSLAIENAAADSWSVGRRFQNLMGTPVEIEEDKKVVYQTGEVVTAEHWITCTATVSDKFRFVLSYPFFDLSADPVVDWTLAFYDEDGVYIANSGDTWQGRVDMDLAPTGSAIVKFSIQTDLEDFMEKYLAVLVCVNGADIIDAINKVETSITVDDTLSIPGEAADAKATGDRIGAVETQIETISGDIDGLEEKVDYNTDCIMTDTIPYATNGTASTSSGGEIVKSFTQDGNTVILNGTSDATSGQGATKFQGCGVCAMWNSATTPASAKVFPIKIKKDRTYRVKIKVLSGTRDSNDGPGYIYARLYTPDGYVLECNLGAQYNESYADYTAVNDTTGTIRCYWARNLICDELNLEISISDVTDEVAIDAVENSVYGGNGVVYNYNLSDSDAYANITGANSSNITENGYVPTSGWENRVTIKKCCVADYIATNYEISITDTPTIVVGSIDANYTASKHATLARINFLTSTVEFLTGASGTGGGNIDGTTIPAYSYDTGSMSNISGTEYRIEIGRKNRCPYIKIYNLKTSAICYEKIFDIYETNSGYGGKAGAMYDYPVFGVTDGVCCFKRAFCTVSPDYDIVFIGDSITEGSNLSVADTWANKIIASDFVKSGLNCGRGGGNIDNAINCARDILPAIRPKMVVVTIGTNGGNTAPKLNTLVELIKRAGATPVINAIPMTTNGYPSTNNLILALDTLHCRFDVATAIDNDVANGQNTAMFQADRTHPNVNGGVALYNNFMANIGSNIYI